MSQVWEQIRDIWREITMDRDLHVEGPMMRRAPRFLVALCALCALMGPMASYAEAQACAISIKLLKIGDLDISTTNTRPVNASECDSGESVTFQLSNLPSLHSLDIYTGSNCSSGSARMAQGTNCVFLGSPQIVVGTRQDIPVVLTSNICGTGPKTSDVELWFIPTNNSDSNNDPTNGCAHILLSVDTQEPVAPTGLNEPSGERSLEVTWTPNGDNKVNRYVVFIDPAPDGGDADAGVTGPCESSTLVPGKILDLDKLPSDIVTKTASGYAASSATVSGDLISGTMATVAVAAQDLAGNLGPLSETSCMHIEKTSGYWDVYKADGGKAAAGCSMLGARSPGALLPALIALLLLRRRRSQS